jgi:ATP-dependent RNA helicase DDX23/PRP28
MENMSADNLKPIDEAEKLDLQTLEQGKNVNTQYRMTYMFSATMPPSVERLARKYLRNPAVVNIGSAGKSSDLIKQVVKWTTRNQKIRELEQTLSQYPNTQAIVFVNTKKSVDFVCISIQKFGYSVASLHGGKSQDLREDALRGFKNGEFDILVATDVAGRGIDVKNIDLVVNYELPFVIESYTHRIGRTGRAGRKGTAVSFLTNEDTDIMYDLKEVLKSSGNSIPNELERHDAAKVKQTRDGKGGWGSKLTREQMQGMQEIIH